MDSGDWVADGFSAGDTLIIATPPSGSSLNNGTTYTIHTATPTTLTLDQNVATATRFVSSAVFFTTTTSCGSSCTVTHYWIQRTDGGSWTANTNFGSGQNVIVTTTASNNTTYAITGVTTTTNTSDTVEVSSAIAAETAGAATFSNPVNKRFDEPIITLTPKKSAIKDAADVSGTASAAVFTRHTGDWSNLAVGVGATISITGTATDTNIQNDGSYVVTAVSGNQITATRGDLTKPLVTTLVGFPMTMTINVTQPAQPSYSANVNFGRSDAGDTITKTSGDWSGTTLEPNAQIRITTALGGVNDGSYTVASVSGATVTLREANRLKANILTTGVSFFQQAIGLTTFNRIQRSDGKVWSLLSTFIVGDTITISGSGPNDGTYSVTAIRRTRTSLAMTSTA